MSINSNNAPLDPSIVPFSGAEQVTDTTTPATPGTTDITLSTLEKSLMEQLIISPDAAIPFLVFPNNSASIYNQIMSQGGSAEDAAKVVVGSMLMKMAQMQDDAINAMLDVWVKSIQEQAKRAEEEAVRAATVDLPKNIPRGSAGYQDWLSTQTVDARQQILNAEKITALPMWFATGVSDYVRSMLTQRQDADKVDISGLTANPLAYSSTDNTMLPLVAGALVVGGSLSTSAIGLADAASAKQAMANPYQDSFTPINANAGVSADYTAASAMIAALLGRSIALTSPMNTVEKATTQGTPIFDANFAKDYADSMVALVSGPGFNNFVMAMLTQKMGDTTPLDDNKRNNMMGQIKTILLTTALVVLYKAYVGGNFDAEKGTMTGDEFLDFMNGKMPIKDDAFKETFTKLRNALLASLPPDEASASTVLLTLANYIDRKPKVQELTDIAKVFQGLNADLPEANSERIASSRG